MSRKSQSQKKRHTKPCKFFQLNRCPHSAEVCDFAHVLGPPYTTADTGSCSYYYTGHCPHGSMCTYGHGEPISPLESPENMDWTGMPSPEPSYFEPVHGYKAFASYASHWPSTNFYPPPTPFSPQSPESMIFSPAPRSRDSIQSIQSIDTVSTSNTSLESDDVVIYTEDPQYEEHTHSHQSQICIVEETPVVHVSPFQHAPPYLSTQPLAYGYPYAHANMIAGKPRSGASIKQKAIKYKTKPCKFWATDKGCPNGSACTFIHGEIFSRRPSPAPPMPIIIPEKGDASRKNFVPVQWRVIGGGVLMGTAQKESNESESEKFNPDIDCSLPSKPAPVALQPLKIISRQRSNSIPPTPSITQVKVEHLFSAESPGVL